MSRSRRLFDLLLRVREIERDREVVAYERAARDLEQADRCAEAQRVEAARGAARAQGVVAAGVAAGAWQGITSGVAALQARSVDSAAARGAAAEQEADARASRTQSERSVAVLERLAERRARADRTRALRAAQRSLDESGRHRRGAALMVLVGLLFAVTVSPVSAAEGAEDPTVATALERPVLGGASLDRLLSDLRTRHRELDQRERDLAERERGVAELERAVDARLAELEAVSQRIEERIAAWEESHASRSVSKLAKIYGAMEAHRAAPLIEGLELELATAVLAKMKPRQSAQLIPLLSAERALAVSRFVGHPLGISPAPRGGEVAAR